MYKEIMHFIVVRNKFLKQDNVCELNHKNNLNRVDIDDVDVKLKLSIKMSLAVC